MNILVIGSGGREHALIWKLRQSPEVRKIFCAPGNGGIAESAECIPIQANQIDLLKRFVHEHNIDLTIVGPEEPLTRGIADSFQADGLMIFGPSAKAAEIEGSKVFAKTLMKKYHIPTADFRVFDHAGDAKDYIRRIQTPCVIKADGLAAGKGVVVCDNPEEAVGVIENMMVKKVFGKAAERIIIEERLTGEELSVFAITDGKDCFLLPPARDHKRALDGDRGKNTGGMGAYAPVPHIEAALMQTIENTIIRPVLEAMRFEQRRYQGVLYAGLMLTQDGPKVIEFNSRFGDPECQALMPLLENGLTEVALSVCRNELRSLRLSSLPLHAVCVVLASGGYPDEYEKGKIIRGLNHNQEKNLMVFHAGTARQGNDCVTAGGRVLGVTAWAENLPEAVRNAYRRIESIHFEGMHYRHDIAARELRSSDEK